MTSPHINPRPTLHNLVELLHWQAQQHPNHPAYIFIAGGIETERLSYAALDRRARAIASMLQTSVESGARVLLLYPPGLEYIAAFFGCLYAGAVAIPSYPPRINRPDARLQGIVNDSQTQIALTTPAIRSNIERRFKHTPKLATVQWEVTDDIDDAWAPRWQPPVISDDTLAFLQYTSGSTSTPKGVMVTHGNILSNERMIAQAFGHTIESTIAGWLPIYHDMGLIGNVLQPLYLGATCHLMSPTEFLQSPYNWLKLISDTQAHTSGGPNFAYDLCVERITPEQRQTLDLSHWQVAFNGAEPVRPQTLQRFSETFAPCGFQTEAFFPCYGLAEATLFVTGQRRSTPFSSISVRADDLEQNRVTPTIPGDGARTLISCGCSQPEQEVVIADVKTLTPSPTDHVGEIWLAGPNVTQGYWNHPEMNQIIFGARFADTTPKSYLRTGDLGFLKDGQLFVTGRLKDLIILRGRNHYPQDIELTVEQAHPALQPGSGAAFVVENDGEERLVIAQEVQRAHRNVDVEEVARAVRQAVSEVHELQTYALVLLRPMSIPKTSSGKIQRHQCRKCFLDGSLKVIGSSTQECIQSVAAIDDIDRLSLLALPKEEHLPRLEAWMNHIIAHALHVAKVDRQQPLVTLGIDSLAAIELQSHIAGQFGVDIPAMDLLEDMTIAQLSRRALAQLATAPTEKVIQLQALADNWPLSFEQERMWYLEQIKPGNPAHHIPYAVQLSGPLDLPALQESFDDLLRRHTALRATFQMQKGLLSQQITPLPKNDVSPLELPICHLEQAIADMVQQPFDLANGPLWRMALFRLGEEEYVLTLVLHHIIADLASLAIIWQDLATNYTTLVHNNALPTLDPTSLQYGDFTHWQRQRGIPANDLAYWKEHLAGLPSKPWLPTDLPRHSQPEPLSAMHSFELPPELLTALRNLSCQQGATLFATLLAGFNALLQRYSGQDDLCVGVPTQGRWIHQTQRMVGFFAYPLALRNDLSSGNPTFQELLARIRTTLWAGYAHQQAPFDQVFQAVRSGPERHKAPLFPVMFSLVRSPLAGVAMPGIKLQQVTIPNTATDFDWFITLVEEEDGRISGHWGYNASLFNAATISTLARAFCDLLAAFTHDPGLPLASYPCAITTAKHPVIANPEDTKPSSRLAITATFTAEPIAESLNFWKRKLNLPWEFDFAPYNQVLQQLLDPNSLLRRNSQGANLILVRFEDWLRFAEGCQAQAGISQAGLEKLEQYLLDFVTALTTASAASKVPHLVFICPPSPNLLNNPYYQAFYQDWQRTRTEVETVSGLYIITPDEIAACYPIETFVDPQADKLGHIPYLPHFFTALGTMVIRKLHAIQRPPYKAIILDCDQTLWQGICGEDGWQGIKITPHHRALQEFMLAQRKAGMLLCLCSKNNEADAWEVFDLHPDMTLRREHLVAWRINWQPKSENIRSLAGELGLGVDSFLFVDDSPVECAEVQANCPGVVILQLPAESERIPRFLANIWAFDHLKVTTEDRLRPEQYRQNSERERLRQETTGDLQDFFTRLELKIKIEAITPAQIERVAQLTQRTNQFNTTTIRRSAAELDSLLQASKLEGLAVTASDRFGDYGLVGVLLFTHSMQELWIDTMLLSCRALGRRVEHHMLAHLGRVAEAHGLKWVKVPYHSTHKNQPVLDFLNDLGENYRSSLDEGYSFRFPTETLLLLNKNVQPEEVISCV